MVSSCFERVENHYTPFPHPWIWILRTDPSTPHSSRHLNLLAPFNPRNGPSCRKQRRWKKKKCQGNKCKYTDNTNTKERFVVNKSRKSSKTPRLPVGYWKCDLGPSSKYSTSPGWRRVPRFWLQCLRWSPNLSMHRTKPLLFINKICQNARESE